MQGGNIVKEGFIIGTFLRYKKLDSGEVEIFIDIPEGRMMSVAILESEKEFKETFNDTEVCESEE